MWPSYREFRIVLIVDIETRSPLSLGGSRFGSQRSFAAEMGRIRQASHRWAVGGRHLVS